MFSLADKSTWGNVSDECARRKKRRTGRIFLHCKNFLEQFLCVLRLTDWVSDAQNLTAAAGLSVEDAVKFTALYLIGHALASRLC